MASKSFHLGKQASRYNVYEGGWEQDCETEDKDLNFIP